MQLREDIQLQSAIRALTEVILPAVDRDNALAIEQTQVVIGLLQLMASRLPLQFQFDCDELARLLAMGRALPTAQDSALAAAVSHGSEVLARARSSPREILEAIRALRAESGAAIGALYRDGDEDARAQLSAQVLAHAEQQLLRERAWLAPQGWELQPDSVPPLEDDGIL